MTSRFSWIRKLFQQWFGSGEGRAAKRRPFRKAARLYVEQLEARDVPATITGTTTLTYTAATGINNNLSVTISGANFVFNDPAETSGITTSITGSSGSGTTTVDVPTSGVTAIVLTLGNGSDAISSSGVVVAGQTVTITNTDAGLTINGPLTTTAKAITVTESGTGDLTDNGESSSTNGNVSLSSTNNLLLGANLNSGSGTITLKANTDGAGSQGYDQEGSSITTTATSSSAVSIAVNTAAGGTGNAVIGMGSTGAAGTVTVAANGGNILWSNNAIYTAFTNSQLGTANGGSNTQTLEAGKYNFSSATQAPSPSVRRRGPSRRTTPWGMPHSRWHRAPAASTSLSGAQATWKLALPPLPAPGIFCSSPPTAAGTISK